MTFLEAQKEMRLAYYGGGSGVFASGVVWLMAGIAAVSISTLAGAVVLFVGGMFIYPLSVVLSKFLNRSGNHQKNNPLGQLALESTVILLIGAFLAFAVFQIRADLFFPVMLMVIGGRYLPFATVYGRRTYWTIGGMLAVAGMLCALLTAPFAFGAFVGGILEIISSIIIFYREKEESQ